MNLDIDTMTLDELKGIIKILVRNTSHAHDRIDILQDRVLHLENAIFKKIPDYEIRQLEIKDNKVTSLK